MWSQVLVLALPGPLRTPALRCARTRRGLGLEHGIARPPPDSADPEPDGRERGVCFSPIPNAWPAAVPTPVQPRCRRREAGCPLTWGPSTLTRKAPKPASWQARTLQVSRVEASPGTDPLGGKRRDRGPRPEHGPGPHLPGPRGRHFPVQVPELYNRDGVPPRLSRGGSPRRPRPQAPGRATAVRRTRIRPAGPAAPSACLALGCRACLCQAACVHRCAKFPEKPPRSLWNQGEHGIKSHQVIFGRNLAAATSPAEPRESVTFPEARHLSLNPGLSAGQDEVPICTQLLRACSQGPASSLPAPPHRGPGLRPRPSRLGPSYCPRPCPPHFWAAQLSATSRALVSSPAQDQDLTTE